MTHVFVYSFVYLFIHLFLFIYYLFISLPIHHNCFDFLINIVFSLNFNC